MKIKKSKDALLNWYWKQIRQAWSEKDGERALQLEKEYDKIRNQVRKDVLSRVNS